MQITARFLLFLQTVRNQCTTGFRNLAQPVNLFHELVTEPFPFTSIVDFNHLFAAIARMREYPTVISLSRHLETSSLGIRLDHYTLSILINCYSQLDRVDLGFSLMGKMMKFGWEPDGVTYNTLLNGLVANDRFEQALHLCDVIVKDGFRPDLVTYGILVNGHCRRGEIDNALDLINVMEYEPDSVIYCTILSGLSREKRISEALGLSLHMVGRGILPRVGTCVSLVRCLCESGQWEDGKELLNMIWSSCVAPDIRGFGMLVNRFCKERMMEQAEYVVNIMRDRGNGCQPDLACYNMLMNGYCKIEKIDSALDLFQEIVRSGLAPDTITYSILFHALFKSDRSHEASRLLDHMAGNGCQPDTVFYSMLLHDLFKSNRPQHAKLLLKEMLSCGESPNVVTLATLLQGLCCFGQHPVAVALYREIERMGLHPNIVVYNILIDGLWNGDYKKEACQLFYELLDKNIPPTGHTYTIMISALCKKGLLQEAIELLEKAVKSGRSSKDALLYHLILYCAREKFRKGYTLGPSTAAKLSILLDCDTIDDSVKEYIEYDIQSLAWLSRKRYSLFYISTNSIQLMNLLSMFQDNELFPNSQWGKLCPSVACL